MNFLDRVREWAGLSDGAKVQLDRRAFLKGLAVTGAGLLVPAATVFDLGQIVEPEPRTTERRGHQDPQRPLTKLSVRHEPGFAVGDLIRIEDDGAKGRRALYEIVNVSPANSSLGVRAVAPSGPEHLIVRAAQRANHIRRRGGILR